MSWEISLPTKNIGIWFSPAAPEIDKASGKLSPEAIAIGVPFGTFNSLLIKAFVSYLSEPPSLLKLLKPKFFRWLTISFLTTPSPPSK